jgi:hypothetical protein
MLKVLWNSLQLSMAILNAEEQAVFPARRRTLGDVAPGGFA